MAYNHSMDDDFVTELMIARITGDTDRADIAIMRRFRTLRPIDIAIFGSWPERHMLLNELGPPNNR